MLHQESFFLLLCFAFLLDVLSYCQFRHARGESGLQLSPDIWYRVYLRGVSQFVLVIA